VANDSVQEGPCGLPVSTFVSAVVL